MTNSMDIEVFEVGKDLLVITLSQVEVIILIKEA